MAVTEDRFELLAEMVRRRSGLALPPGKLTLASSKLAPVAARFGFRSVGALIAELEDEPDELARAVTEAMTTNETSFFRDADCFDYLRHTILPALTAARASTRRLRIWCAAASTGQEAYSLAMLLDEMGLADSGWKIHIFASDLNRDAVARMREGLYTRYEVQRGLPFRCLAHHFSPEGDHWRIAGRLRRSLRIHHFNLLDHYGWLGALDLVLCRNVLLYFAPDAKRETLARIAGCLMPGGWLILGATETLSGTGGMFVSAAGVRGIYVKPHNAAGRQAKLAG